MKIAVLSDIHGNYEALKTCVEYALKQGITRFAFLGDYVGELAEIEQVMQYLYELEETYDCIFIRGNKEEYFLNYKANGEKGWEEYHSTTGCLYYGYQKMKERDLTFFAEMEIVKTVSFEGMESFTICHGSPRNVKEELHIGNANTLEVLEESDTRMILCGHTHSQFKTEHQGKVLINPGSVGLPLDSAGKTQFVILHGENGLWKEEFVNLFYDTEKAIEKLYEAGLDKRAEYWTKVTIQELRTGLSTFGHAEILNRAMEICREKQGYCNWPDIPEECWKEAYEEYFGSDDLQSHDASCNPEKTGFPVRLSENKIYESYWMSMFSDRVQMSDGSVIEKYHRVHVPNDSVAVVIMNEKDEILLIRSKRYTTGRMEWEIPAGGINPGECAENAARRESREETGCEIDKVKYLCSMHPCNGVTDIMIHYYMAKVSGENSEFDCNEVSEKKWVSKKEVLKLIQNNRTKSEISAFAILYALQFGD